MVSRTLEERIAHNKIVKKRTLDNYLRKKYKISAAIKEKMKKDQDDRCANKGCTNVLAWEQLEKIDTDHCHRSGKVRALLCRGCNTQLGVLEGALNGTSKRLVGLLEYRDAHLIALGTT